MTTKTAYTSNEITTFDYMFYQYSYATAIITEEAEPVKVEAVKTDDTNKLFAVLDKAVNSEAAQTEIKETVKFLVDDNLTNWIEVYNWIIGLGTPEDKSQYENRSLTEIYFYIMIYSSHNNPIKRVRFIECVPTSLSGIFFGEDINETTTVGSTVRIAYRRYEFVDLG